MNVHHLELEDLVALTVEVAAMAKIPSRERIGFQVNKART